jgi:hypothetical protein
MKTFIANLKHAARGNGCATTIGGGSFSPAECLEVVTLIRDLQETLAAMTDTVETVAHLRCMELELLPVADKARALLARLED